MIKELKFLFFILVIFLFFFLTFKFYFSDTNKMNSFRSLNQIDKKILIYSKNLILLKDDTKNAIEYVKKTTDKNKNNYNFWKLKDVNEK